MSDTLIIAFLAAGCFVLWLFLHRQKPASLRPVAATSENGWFTPTEEEDPPPLDTSRLRETLGIDKPSPTTESVSGERSYTFIATAVLSPAWHNENGWPAVAVEYFPIVGSIKAESIRLTAIVRALYEGSNLPDKEISEAVPNPPEVLLSSLHACGQRLKATFEIGAGINERARKDLPDGYNAMPKSVSVDIRMELTGRSA